MRPFRFRQSAAAALLLAALMIAPASGSAEEQITLPPAAPPAEEHRHEHPSAAPQPQEHKHEHPTGREAPPGVGLKERLGERIPLETTFLDEEGKPVRLGDLVDRPTIIAPVYFTCPGVCNFIQTELSRTLPDVSLRPGEQYRVLSVSFDETDTPEIAAQSKRNYMTAMRNGFPPEAWRFLTGEPQQIRAVTDALGYGFQREGQDFLHPVVIAVVAPDGKITRYHYGTRFLPMDLTLSLVEASEGRVGATIKRVLGFCFSYDPQGKRYVFNILRVSAVVVLTTAAAFLTFLIFSGRKRG
jgi:protein SCO1